jgi:hypothetical protein
MKPNLREVVESLNLVRTIITGSSRSLFKNRDSQNPNGKTAPQICAPKTSKMLFGHPKPINCVVHALSQERIRVLVKEHQKHVVSLVPLSIVFVVAHQNTGGFFLLELFNSHAIPTVFYNSHTILE